LDVVRWIDRDSRARILVEQFEAFLEGRYAELCKGWGEPVPPWAWMNLLAHASEDRLRAAADSSDGEQWQRARRFVAGELVDLVDTRRRSLATIQRRVLVPFELRAIESSGGRDRPVPTGRLVNDLLEALSADRAHLRA
jgi:hypothetical protein